jgi:hypothetical protein
MPTVNMKTLQDPVDVNRLWMCFGPMPLGTKFNTAVTANTNIFTTDLDPFVEPSHVRIYACFVDSVVLTLRRTLSGTPVSELLNQNLPLTANSPFIFDTIVDIGETINLRTSANTTALKISVLELIDYGY